jgi:hypothetical protein
MGEVPWIGMAQPVKPVSRIGWQHAKGRLRVCHALATEGA